jgi:hypothetical protein
MSRYQDRRFRRRYMTASHLALLAGLVCIWALPARATIVVQARGLQTGTTPGVSVHGQIQIANGLVDDAEQIHLKVLELVATTKYGWLPVDPNDPDEHYWQERESKSQSCIKWVSLGQTEVTVEPTGSATIPVDICIPKDANGLYRAAVVVHVPPPGSQVGVAIGYDLVVPMLLEVATSANRGSAECEPKDFEVELHPKPLKLAQDVTSDDPYHTYTGVARLTIGTASPVQMSVHISATSAAGGSWVVTIDPANIPGSGEITLCVTGTNVFVDKIVGGAKDVRPALVGIEVRPDLSPSPFLWRDKDQAPSPSDPNEDGV